MRMKTEHKEHDRDGFGKDPGQRKMNEDQLCLKESAVQVILMELQWLFVSPCLLPKVVQKRGTVKCRYTGQKRPRIWGRLEEMAENITSHRTFREETKYVSIGLNS